MKTKIFLISLLTLLWLSGCGQKGDLYKNTDAPPPTLEQAGAK